MDNGNGAGTECQYLNMKYTVVDITAVDETTFYLLILFGEDGESANFLVKYTVS